jgi:DNA-binding transcriptional MerR regulator
MRAEVDVGDTRGGLAEADDKAIAAMILRDLGSKTLRQLAREHGLSLKTVRRIVEEHIQPEVQASLDVALQEWRVRLPELMQASLERLEQIIRSGPDQQALQAIERVWQIAKELSEGPVQESEGVSRIPPIQFAMFVQGNVQVTGQNPTSPEGPVLEGEVE